MSAPPAARQEPRPPAPPCSEQLPLQRFAYDFAAMGMKYQIVLYGPDLASVEPAVLAAEARVRELDRIMSDYHTESELSKLCDNSGPGKPVRLSPELFTVLERAQQVSRETDGAFDVTIGPVIQLWRTARRTKKLPPPELLQEARSQVGFMALRLDELSQTAELTRDGVSIDLGGIAAGYACDEVLKILKAHGLPRALIDASGDLLAGDPPPGRDGWRVAVTGVDGQTTSQDLAVMIANAAITTSGDARQFVEIDGVRYSHIVDPKTGLGLSRRSSTTVIAPTGWQADAYATAANVLGTEAGIRWIESQLGCSALMIEVRDGREIRSVSSRYPATETSP
jgi:thiamine biosynthesis lipoprotein